MIDTIELARRADLMGYRRRAIKLWMVSDEELCELKNLCKDPRTQTAITKELEKRNARH